MPIDYYVYFAYFRLAEIKLLLGRNIVLFPSKVKTPSGDILGVTFNVPITFYNWSPQGGTVYRMRLIIGRQQQNEYYDMTWTTFVKIGSGGNFEDEELAQPIPMGGRSSVNKIIRFDWNPEFTGEKLDIRVEKYELMIFAWTKNTEKPDLKYVTSFLLRDEQYAKYQNNISSGNFGPIWLSLDDAERPNTVITKNRVDSFYLDKR
ncbi:hypothetical protein ACE1B6_28230 [Aerosakkonemataceae cyanobacterium BLCC-F154]|uniref:Uncharacterized protein n=1 Tax=Floridaenema fluviatile BLCC-F154 TaxID=3153640 RepID=A0ABV4YJZ2_9CYAN